MVEITNVDSHKLMYHPERVSEWRCNGDCFPIYVEIGLTNACNHKCIFCALDFLGNGGNFMNKEVLALNLKDMAEKGLKSIMFAGEGEPLLHKDIGFFVKHAKELGLDISITTNGILFDESKIEQILPNLTWIRFSIDSGTPDNYAKIHGTSSRDFEILMENLQKAVEFKRKNNLKTTIGTQFLMIPDNSRQAVLLAERLKNIGVDNMQIKPYSKHPGSINNLAIDPVEYNKIKDDLMKFDSKDFRVLFRKATTERIQEGITYPECYGLPFFALIDSNGNVIPCNLFYGNNEFNYGNINEKSFSEIWYSERKKEILKKLKEKGIEDCRRGCRLDVINRYLHRLKSPWEHDNFI